MFVCYDIEPDGMWNWFLMPPKFTYPKTLDCNVSVWMVPGTVSPED